jgi:hypothetical protein
MAEARITRYVITPENVLETERSRNVGWDTVELLSTKEWYANDPDYRRVVDIIEREVITKLQYDWDSYLSGRSRSYLESIDIGLGICDIYARLTSDVLTAAGYKVELWSSPGRHSWNHVIMPDGRTLYIDTTWYDNNYENHPTNSAPDFYGPWYITYDKNLFERGLRGTIRMHGAWLDAREIRNEEINSHNESLK